jgi:phosphatidylglycerophosphatase A
MIQQPTIKKIVTFFHVGLIPKAPGTFGTLAAIPLAALMIWLGPLIHMAFSLLLMVFAIWACEMYERQKGGHDHPEAVIDEVVGFLITMVWMPLTWQSFVFGFCLFRFFDIVKPWPIGWMDRKIPGGMGVVLDDVAAGLVANVILQVIYTKTAWLGVQIL